MLNPWWTNIIKKQCWWWQCVSMPGQTFSCVSMPLGIQFKTLNNWPSGPDQALLSWPLQIHLLTPSLLLFRPSLLHILMHLIFYMNSSIYLESLLPLLHLANSYSSSVSVQRWLPQPFLILFPLLHTRVIHFFSFILHSFSFITFIKHWCLIIHLISLSPSRLLVKFVVHHCNVMAWPRCLTQRVFNKYLLSKYRIQLLQKFT